MLAFLAQTKTLWFTFILTLLLTVAFVVVMQVWQFGLIDEMYNAADIKAHIAAMSPTQRTVHAWTTGTLDVAYPLCYGAFFIGVALKSFGRFGFVLALPSLLVIPVDLTEGFSQIMLLGGHNEYMGLKIIATPLKLGLFGLGLVIALIGLALMFFKFLKNRVAAQK